MVILVIASVGLLWKIWQEKHDKPFGWLQLYVFDVVVQLVMLSCMLRMPAEMRMPTIKAVAPPILLVCLVITLVISLILKRQAARRDAEQELVVNRKALVRERGLLWRVIDPHADGPCSIASNRDPVDRRS